MDAARERPRRRPAREGRAAAPGRGVTPPAGPAPDRPGTPRGRGGAFRTRGPARRGAGGRRVGRGRRQAARPFSPPSLPQRLTFRGGRAPPMNSMGAQAAARRAGGPTLRAGMARGTHTGPPLPACPSLRGRAGCTRDAGPSRRGVGDPRSRGTAGRLRPTATAAFADPTRSSATSPAGDLAERETIAFMGYDQNPVKQEGEGLSDSLPASIPIFIENSPKTSFRPSEVLENQGGRSFSESFPA